MPTNNSKTNGDHTQIEAEDASLVHAEMLQDIVSGRPGFLIRWGNIVFLLVLVVICIACWYIKYPDKIKASGKLTSINAPKAVVNLIGGKLIRLDVSEYQEVDKGDILGFMESTARHDEVLRLSATLDTIQSLLHRNSPEKMEQYFLEPFNFLGEVQTAYQSFSQSYLLFNNYLADGYYIKRKAMLLEDQKLFEELDKNLAEQEELQEQDLALIQETFDVNEALKNEAVISAFDYRIEKSKLLNKKLSLPQIRSSIINNQSQQNAKKKEILELENTINQQKIIFQQSLNTFKSQLEDWKRRYVLTAPIAGRVAFVSFIQENQQLEPNQTICYINPEDSQYFVELSVPQANFGKVALGQQVLLKFQSYPFQEYGSVEGSVVFVSYVPVENNYLAKVSLVDGLRTNYDKQIQYRDGLVADGEIITKDLRLLERFYYNIVRQIED